MTPVIDPYVDPEVGDLRNLLGAKTPEELRILEPQAVFANELEMTEMDIPRTDDLVELRAIHAQLFKGVYNWAGQLRTVDIKKHRAGAGFFLPVGYIEQASSVVFNELTQERVLRGLPRDTFVERLTYFYDQLNYIHPFREGNGRTQRVFWQRVSNDAGYVIEWERVVGDENDLACVAAMEHNDREPLLVMFTQIVR